MDFFRHLNKKAVFDFVCHENITEKVFFYDTKKVNKMTEGSGKRLLITELKFKRIKKKTYTYDYQMVRKGEEGFEKRILLKEDKRSKHEENAQLKLQRFAAKYLICGPVGFLSKYWQDFFDRSSQPAIHRRDSHRPIGKKHTKYTVEIIYDSYKFFTVETDIHIR